LRVRLVHAEPAAPARRLAGRRPGRGARQTAAPRIITRTEWGGDTVPPRSSPSYGQVLLAFVHHTVTANAYLPEQSAGIVLAIARYHRNTNGWNDIGYNFLVDQYGQVFEGRAGGVEEAVVGAQAQGWNSVSTGVACLGDFSAIAQSEAAMEALAQLLGWKLSLHGVPVEGQITATSLGGSSNRYRSGTPVVFERISGHRDGNVTSCPGAVLYSQLPDLRARAARYAVAPPPPEPTAAVSMRTSTNVVRGIAPLVVTGTVQFNDGAPLDGVPVQVFFAPPGGPPGQLAQVACAANGSFSATVTLAQSGLVAARYPGDGERPPADSPPTEVTILPRLAVELSTREVRAGRRVAVRGSVTPPGAVRAEVFVEHREDGRWRRIRHRRVAVRGDRYGFFVRLRRPGGYRITVAVPGAKVTRAVRATG
ncbi:MAG TPA: N-acetylmuramoyl-L-alanine amidase, partial [Solirubrobacteraceae bacterium]|nr:N-acetylmuramoyl-L-alanine amidase [Solirubrobacteraceae bacterium]